METHPFPTPLPSPPYVWWLVAFALLMIPCWAAAFGLFAREFQMKRSQRFLRWAIVVLVSCWLANFCYVQHEDGKSEEHRRIEIATSAFLIAATCGFTTFISLVMQSRRVWPTFPKIIVAGFTSFFFVVALTVALSIGNDNRKEASPRTQCINNMKQIALAIHNWNDEHKRLPDSRRTQKAAPEYSWRVGILDFVDQSSLKEKYDFKSEWDSPADLPIAQTNVAVFRCPVERKPQDKSGRYVTPYLLLTGPQTAFPDGIGLRLSQITDGTTNTALVSEACGRRVVWTDPRDVDISVDPIGVNQPGLMPGTSPSVLSSFHPGGANLMMADGSVRFIKAGIDPSVLRSLLTATGGEPAARE